MTNARIKMTASTNSHAILRSEILERDSFHFPFKKKGFTSAMHGE